MSVEVFLSLLIGSVIVTIALTEVLKKLLNASGTPYRANAVALDSAMLATTGVCVIYRLPFGLGFDYAQIVRLIILILCTWFTSMIAYDKWVQTKQQYMNYKEKMGVLHDKK